MWTQLLNKWPFSPWVPVAKWILTWCSCWSYIFSHKRNVFKTCWCGQLLYSNQLPTSHFLNPCILSSPTSVMMSSVDFVDPISGIFIAKPKSESTQVISGLTRTFLLLKSRWTKQGFPSLSSEKKIQTRNHFSFCFAIGFYSLIEKHRACDVCKSYFLIWWLRETLESKFVILQFILVIRES